MMRDQNGFRLILFASALLFIFGCSGSGNPTVPGADTIVSAESQIFTGDNRVLWGFWDCFVNPDATIDIVPMHGATFTANVNQLLEGSNGNLLIQNLDTGDYPTEGRLDCTVSLRHPLPGLDMYNGFDVWGVFMHNGSTPLVYDDLHYSDGSGDDEARLLNPDGYTRWFNYPEFNGAGVPILKFWPGKLSDLPNPYATLNPYKIFADGLDTYDDFHDWINTPGNSENRGIFSAGHVNSRRYELKFPMPGGNPVLEFQYAVIATWEPGDPTLTGNPEIYEPFDFPPAANCEEAFFLDVSTVGSDLFFVDSSSNGGNFRAGVEVFDWQGGTVAGNGVPNEVESIIIESDFVVGGTYKITHPELDLIALPSTADSSVFQVEITGCAPQAAGPSGLWIIVEAAGEHGETYDQDFPTPYPDDARRAAFLPSSVDVSSEPPIPPFIEYNFRISTDRTVTGLVDGVKLEWDEMPPSVAGVNIYKMSAYDPDALWELLTVSPLSGTEYIDGDILGYEGYMYYIAATNGYLEADPSQTGFVLLENAEEIEDTFSLWEDDWRQMGSYYERWYPLPSGGHAPPPANGTYSWDESGLENFPTLPGDYWTGFWMLLCSPVLPVEPDTSTAFVEFMHRVQTYDMSPPKDSGYAGGKIGVCSAVDHNAFFPSDDFREGFQYPVADVPGIYYWGQFPNCEDPEPGFAGVYNTYQLSGYNVSDIFSTSNPRVGFAFGACNYALGYGWNVDDIAIIIY